MLNSGQLEQNWEGIIIHVHVGIHVTTRKCLLCVHLALNEKPNYRKIHNLPIHDWHGVGADLNLDRHKLKEIWTNFKDDHARQKREMLDQWLSQDNDATYNKLAYALIKNKEKEAAKKLVESISKLVNG